MFFRNFFIYLQQDNVVETTVTEESIEDGNDEFLPASEEDSKEEGNSSCHILLA